MSGAPVSESTEALKFDQGKLRFELLSVPALRGLAAVLTFGAKKYADHNWRKGFDWSRLYGAAMRHLMAHMEGEDIDPESGLSHLDHAMCCLMFLSEHEKCGLGKDDRYPTRGKEVLKVVQKIRQEKRIDMAEAGEGVHRKRRRGETAGVNEESVLIQLQTPMSIMELARALKISGTSAGYWVHRLSSRLVTEPGTDKLNRRVVRYVVA